MAGYIDVITLRILCRFGSVGKSNFDMYHLRTKNNSLPHPPNSMHTSPNHPFINPTSHLQQCNPPSNSCSERSERANTGANRSSCALVGCNSSGSTSSSSDGAGAASLGGGGLNLAVGDLWWDERLDFVRMWNMRGLGWWM